MSHFNSLCANKGVSSVLILIVWSHQHIFFLRVSEILLLSMVGAACDYAGVTIWFSSITMALNQEFIMPTTQNTSKCLVDLTM
jgi:hypothetical protein